MTSRSRDVGRKWQTRVGWLILIYAASVLALGAIALILRAIMSAAGMTL